MRPKRCAVDQSANLSARRPLGSWYVIEMLRLGD